MILADKIIELRKKNGWSQEELAEKMNVTRQSVSKWEGAQSVPDLDKILLLSQIFGVSTDYLLKEEMEETEYTEVLSEVEEPMRRRVSMEEANEFLAIKETTAKQIAMAAFACILSPICLMVLATISEFAEWGISENMACGIGLIILVIMVTGAVAVFISCGMKTSPFEYLETCIIETEYGVSGMVKERQKQYRDTYIRNNIVGTCICILSAIPIFVGAFFSKSDIVFIGLLAATLVLVGVGVIFFITAGIKWASMEKLLQEGEYSLQKKRKNKVIEVVATVYWLVIVAVFLGYSFLTEDWGRSWIIWPVAGVLFGAVAAICSIFEEKK